MPSTLTAPTQDTAKALELVPGFTGRVTPDGRISLYDALAAIGVKNPRDTWSRIESEHYKGVAICDTFQFPGQGQRPTPIVNFEGKEFTEGVEYDKIEGQAYQDLLSLLCSQDGFGDTSYVSPTAQRILLLYEPGLDKVLFRTRQPAGIRMLHWYAHELKPALKAYALTGDTAPLNTALRLELPAVPIWSTSLAARSVERLPLLMGE